MSAAARLKPQEFGKRRVEVDGRVFFVGFKLDGTPANIVERRLFYRGKVNECWGNSTYWHHSHRLPLTKHGGKGKSVVVRVLEAAGVDPRFIAGH